MKTFAIVSIVECEIKWKGQEYYASGVHRCLSKLEKLLATGSSIMVLDTSMGAK